MNENLKQRILDLVDVARRNEMVFVFGDETYSPDEAEAAMLAYADIDIEGQGLTEDEYIERQQDCIAGLEE